MQRRSPVSCLAERSACSRDELVDILPRRAGELERIRVVVGEHLGVIVRSAERLDPLCRPHVLLRAVRARDLPVRDVADEQVLERELRLSFDRAAPRALHELLLPQRMQLLLARAERTEPEDLSDDRRVL